MKERANVCAVPAASVIGEAVAAFEIAKAMQEKFGGDSLRKIKRKLLFRQVPLRQKEITLVIWIM